MEKINIKELKGLYDLPNGVEFKNYISIKDKYAMARGIVNVVVKEDESGVLYKDYFADRITKVLTLVRLYTNIELLDDSYENYDILAECNIITKIENYIGNDAAEFYGIVDDLVFETINNYNCIEHIIARKTDDMLAIFNRTMKHVDGMLDKGDPNKIAKYLSKGIEMVALKLPDLSKLDVFESLNSAKDKRKGMN